MNIEIKDSGHLVLTEGTWKRSIDPHNQADLDLYSAQLTQSDLDAISSKWASTPVISTSVLSQTPYEEWLDNMVKSDLICPRWSEDYITENSIVLAPGRAKDNYDVKVALRATKPGA